jgi:serine/threonine protein kinase
MAPETARIGVSDPRTDVYALGVIFYEMLTGTVPFVGETAVDVMLKVVSEAVIPPRTRAPTAEITPEAEQLIMKALSKDPRQRQQSMEELFEELQHCYGSVRYRRSLERSAPIPLQKMKRPGSGPFADPIPRVTPPDAIDVRGEGTATAAPAGPILLTRRKERPKTKTLPLEPLGPDGRPTPQPGRPALEVTEKARTVVSLQTAASEAKPGQTDEHDEWSEPALPDNWMDLEID